MKYKCLENGIELILQEESYTSKCSSIDLEEVNFHEEYKGRRLKRGLFESHNKILLNSDVNGSYNILRKYLKNVKVSNLSFQAIISKGCMVYPVKFNRSSNYFIKDNEVDNSLIILYS